MSRPEDFDWFPSGWRLLLLPLMALAGLLTRGRTGA